MVEKYWFYWRFEWFWDWIFGDLWCEILWIKCDFCLSSIEVLFYKGLRGFLGGMRWFLMVWKLVKCLILVGLLEVCIEVILGIFGWFRIFKSVYGWNRYLGFRCRTLVLKCKLSPIMAWKHTIILQYYIIFYAVSCFLFIFATWIIAVCQVKMLYTLQLILHDMHQHDLLS